MFKLIFGGKKKEEKIEPQAFKAPDVSTVTYKLTSIGSIFYHVRFTDEETGHSETELFDRSLFHKPDQFKHAMDAYKLKFKAGVATMIELGLVHKRR